MNADDNGKDNPNKRDGSPSRQAPCPKKQALDDLNDMRAAAATAAEAEAAAAPTAGGAATSVLREVRHALLLCMHVACIYILGEMSIHSSCGQIPHCLPGIAVLLPFRS